MVPKRLRHGSLSRTIAAVFFTMLLTPLTLLQRSPNLIGRLFFLVCMAVFFSGCAQTEKQADQSHLYWPKPPDPPRFIYTTTLRSEDSIRALTNEERFRIAVTGNNLKTRRILAKPFGVAAGNGLVVVTDSIRKMGFIFNLRRKRLYPFGNVGKKGLLTKPLGVALDRNGQVYVVDGKARKVFVYDAVGMFLREFADPSDLDRPVGVAVSMDGARVYVVDAGGIDSERHRVVVYDQKGSRLSVIGKRGVGDGEFNLPTQVAVAPDKTLYVLDGGNFRVQAFTPQGKFLRAWGENGRNFGNFARPRGLAIDADGYVYVSDAAFRNVQVFTPEGQLLLAIGGEGLQDKPGQFALPAGLAVDERGHVYIVDQLFAKVDVLRRLSEGETGQVVAARKAKAIGTKIK